MLDCIDATGPVCRYLVGKPGADFLVQCGRPVDGGPWPDKYCPEHHPVIAIRKTGPPITITELMRRSGMWPVGKHSEVY